MKTGRPRKPRNRLATETTAVEQIQCPAANSQAESPTDAVPGQDQVLEGQAPASLVESVPENAPKDAAAGNNVWLKLRQEMDALSDEQIATVEATIQTTKQWISDAFTRRYGISDRDLRAIRYLLAQKLKETVTCFNLVAEAMSYRETMRIARHIQTIRAARATLRAAIAEGKQRGAPAVALEDCERLAR